jgi:uncharacterized protein (TIGR03083 family)
VDRSGFLSSADSDGRALLVGAEDDWARLIPDCPGWDTAELVRHTGGIYQWMAAIVGTGRRVSRSDLPPAPASHDDLPRWYLDALSHAHDVLSSAQPTEETWTFSTAGDQTALWWCRRLAVEVAIHRWDLEHALAADGGAAPQPIDTEVAAAGIEEFVVEFLPGLLAHQDVTGIEGTLHLHATDGMSEWWIDLDARGVARPEHGKADCAVRGTCSDLLLWLTNRVAANTLEVLGMQRTAENWAQLRR